MINEIEYEATFMNGRTLKQNFVLTNGVTLITGANEAGKSFCLEMIRFALFGSKALRGEVKGYKNVKSSLKFQIKTNTYGITRTLSGAELTDIDNNVSVAVGTKPTNQAVIDLFGFDLDVFDIACSVNQGEVERLGYMKPTERKQMIDQIVGLDNVEALERMAKAKEKEFAASAATVSGTLVQPIQPDMPEGYVSSETIRERVIDAAAALREAESIGKFQNLPEPIKPVEPEISESEEELENQVRAYHSNIQAKSKLDMILARPIPPSIEELEHQEMLINDHIDWKRKLRFLKENPEPDLTYSIEELEKMLEDHALIKQIEAWKMGAVQCEHCGKKTSTTEDNRYPGDPPEVDPVLSVRDIRSRIEDITYWNSDEIIGIREQMAEIKEPDEEPSMTKAEISEHHATYQMEGVRRELEDALEDFTGDNPSEKLELLIEYKSLSRKYDRLYEAWQEDQKRKNIDLDSLRAEANRLKELETSCLMYERSLTSYHEAETRYSEGMKKVEEHRSKEKQWTKAILAMRELRRRIKQYLLPSLNKVSSNLLQNMTNGARQQIKIDDEFEIMVDGQKLVTLSGSGKAVTNLAIRIGLGQVLTNGVFSVLMADEIDGSMDQERAEATIQTLTRLTNNVGQILVVSHKQHELEHRIEIQ